MLGAHTPDIGFHYHDIYQDVDIYHDRPPIHIWAIAGTDTENEKAAVDGGGGKHNFIPLYRQYHRTWTTMILDVARM